MSEKQCCGACAMKCHDKLDLLLEARKDGAERVVMTQATFEAITGVSLCVAGLEVQIDCGLKDGEYITQ